MKKFLAAIFLVGLLTTGCGSQKPAEPPAQKTEESKPAFEQAVEPVQNAASQAAQTATDAANAATDAASQAATDAQNMATDAANAATDAAQNMATDAAVGAVDAAAGAVDAAKEMLDADLPAMISSAPSIGTTRESFEAYGDGQYVATYDANGRVISMEINTPTIDNDMLAGVLPSDVVITSFDTNSSDATRQVNHFQGTSEQLKRVNPSSGGRFEAFTNFDKQTSQFLGGSIKVAQ